MTIWEEQQLIEKREDFEEHQTLGAVIGSPEAGEFDVPEKLNHTHEGSLGNLCNDEIEKRFYKALKPFDDQKALIENKFEALLT